MFPSSSLPNIRSHCQASRGNPFPSFSFLSGSFTHDCLCFCRDHQYIFEPRDYFLLFLASSAALLIVSPHFSYSGVFLFFFFRAVFE